MRAATSGDPNYFPNDADEENDEEESEDPSLVENELVLGEVVVDEENVFNHDQNENNVLEDVLNQRERDIQKQRDGVRKSQQKQADKMLEATNRRFIIIFIRISFKKL